MAFDQAPGEPVPRHGRVELDRLGCGTSLTPEGTAGSVAPAHGVGAAPGRRLLDLGWSMGAAFTGRPILPRRGEQRRVRGWPS